MPLDSSGSLQMAKGFRIEIADTPEKREAAYRLRYQVYCIERGYEPGEGAIETDRFDHRAGHALLIQSSTERVVGTVRLVAPVVAAGYCPAAELDLPMHGLCSPAIFKELPSDGRMGEVSRFSISKDLRDTAAVGSVPLRLGLVRGLVQLSAEMGINAWCAVMEPTLLRLLRVSGIHFTSLGPAIEYRGLRQPSWNRLDDILTRMRRERPAVWDYVTDYGALWPETVEAATAVAA